MKLTCIIPVYNTRPDHLIECVYSILKQDDGIDHDIIIVDDGSENHETLMALKFLLSISRRIKLITLSVNSGTAVALNKGHEHCETEFIAIMGSQDVSDLSRFRVQREYLMLNTEVDVIGTNLFSYMEKDITRKSIFTSSHREKPPTNAGNWVVNHGTVVYRKSAVDSVGGYNGAYRRAQDVELWGRMMAAGFKFANITQVLYAWRKDKV